MQWYLLKTWVGREEELVKEIRRTVPGYLYQEAFVIRNERIWRRQGRSILHPELLFKGCVFLTCKESEPLFRRLERVPAMSRLMVTGDISVYPLTEEDAVFLQQLSGEDHVVKVSYALREDDGVYRILGPLENCLDDIEHFEFRKRFVKLRRRLWGEEKVIALGLLLNEDVKEGIICEKFDVPVELPEHSTVLMTGRDGISKNYA